MMNNLSLTTSEFERLLLVFGWVVGIIWFLAFIAQWAGLEVPAMSAAWRAFSPALAFTTFLFGFFYKVAWKWEWLANLMSRPVVEGIWKGELRSDFGGQENKPIVVPIVFVIKQSYLSLSIESFTEHQEGESRLEALLRNSKTEATRLCYVFELRKLYPGAHALISGAGELKLVSSARELRGTYWTNTPTHGQLSLKLVSRKCAGISSFQDALKKLPGAVTYF